MQCLRAENGSYAELYIRPLGSTGANGGLGNLCSASHHTRNIIPLSLHFPPASHGKWTVKDKSGVSSIGISSFSGQSWNCWVVMGKGEAQYINTQPGCRVIVDHLCTGTSASQNIFLRAPGIIQLTETLSDVWGHSLCRDHGGWQLRGHPCTTKRAEWWGHSELTDFTPFTSFTEQPDTFAPFLDSLWLIVHK